MVGARSCCAEAALDKATTKATVVKDANWLIFIALLSKDRTTDIRDIAHRLR